VQIEFAEPTAQADQRRYRHDDRQPGPSDSAIEVFGEPSQPVQDCHQLQGDAFGALVHDAVDLWA
jgi:hypothetical protein